MNVLDLFSGVGGFTLGLERAGMRTVAFCECDAFCKSVLRAHWPGVPIYDDVRTLGAARLGADGIADVHVICGGFPCQDISIAGRGAGLAGERSGLWSHFARLIREVRPAYAIVENVAGLLARGLGDVLAELATLGYDAEWHCIPACAVGADHERDRIWIIAYPECGALRHLEQRRALGWHDIQTCRQTEPCNDGAAQPLAHTNEPRLERWLSAELRQCARELSLRSRGARDAGRNGITDAWFSESGVRRVADGVPYRVDRLRALGNAVVPQIPQIIGRAIMRAEGVTTREQA